jgi:hypothetical protein
MIVYKSLFSSIETEPEKRLLSAVWFKESIDLDQENVKSEISKILLYIRENSITSIIVDSRNYPFRENENLQAWINHTFMPQIIDSGITRYAIVVEFKIKNTLDDFEYLDEDGISVEYFTDPEQAQKWAVS